MELSTALGWDRMEPRAALQPFSSLRRNAKPTVQVPDLLSAFFLMVFLEGPTGLSVSPDGEPATASGFVL